MENYEFTHYMKTSHMLTTNIKIAKTICTGIGRYSNDLFRWENNPLAAIIIHHKFKH